MLRSAACEQGTDQDLHCLPISVGLATSVGLMSYLFYVLKVYKNSFSFAISVSPDQMPHSVAPDLGLYSLPVSQEIPLVR